MQYENKILNFHIYLYFPSNIFKKFKNIKIKGLTYYILTCIISLVFTRNKSVSYTHLICLISDIDL